MTTREEFNEEVYSIRANVGGHGNTKWSLECIIDYANTLEEELKAQLKSKDEEIERLREIINTSIEEIEYAIIKPQYAEVYLNNAIRFLKDTK